MQPRPPIMGQLPIERITPDCIFSRVEVDYAGPIYIQHGYVRKPIAIKVYICIFVSLSIKAVHIELVSDITTEAFLASLRGFYFSYACCCHLHILKYMITNHSVL